MPQVLSYFPARNQRKEECLAAIGTHRPPFGSGDPTNRGKQTTHRDRHTTNRGEHATNGREHTTNRVSDYGGGYPITCPRFSRRDEPESTCGADDASGNPTNMPAALSYLCS